MDVRWFSDLRMVGSALPWLAARVASAPNFPALAEGGTRAPAGARGHRPQPDTHRHAPPQELAAHPPTRSAARAGGASPDTLRRKSWRRICYKVHKVSQGRQLARGPWVNVLQGLQGSTRFTRFGKGASWPGAPGTMSYKVYKVVQGLQGLARAPAGQGPWVNVLQGLQGITRFTRFGKGASWPGPPGSMSYKVYKVVLYQVYKVCPGRQPGTGHPKGYLAKPCKPCNTL